MDGKLPTPVPPNINDSREYPFESMTQARVIHRRENTLGLSGVPSAVQVGSNNFAVQPPPPPYPATTASIVLNKTVPTGSGNIAISSPLLVNLLQNEGTITSQQQKHSTALMKSGQEHVLVGGSVELSSNTTSVIDSKSDLSANKNISNLKQTMSVHPIHIKSQSQTLVSGVANSLVLPSSVQSESLLSQQQTLIQTNNILSSNNNSLSSAIVSQQQPQSLPQTTIPKLHVSGSDSGTTISVPSTSNVNTKMQTRFPPQQQLIAQQQLIRNAIPLMQTQSSSSPSSSTSQNLHLSSISLQQKTEQQKLSSHSTVHSTRLPFQQQVQQLPMTPNTQSATGGIQVNGPMMSSHLTFKSPQTTSTSLTNTVDATTVQMSHQSASSNVEAVQSPYGSRWALKPMDSATKSSFQEFTRYQMQYNLSQQQQQAWKTDTIQHLADLDELTKNDLDSLLPNLHDGDLATALDIDTIKPPLDTAIGGLIDGPLTAPTLAVKGGLKEAETTGKTSSGKERQFLINPLTAELEPMPSEESGDENEEPVAFVEFNSEISNSIYSDDENSCSTAFSKTASDRSDNERSSNSENSLKSKGSRKQRTEKPARTKLSKEKPAGKNSLLKEKLQQGLKEKIYGKDKSAGKNKVKKAVTIAEPFDNKAAPEKIKLRLKLEKSEPVTPAYKVDVSYGSSPKRAQSTITLPTNIQAKIIQQPTPSPTSSTISSPSSAQSSPASEELRVPPLHISLRGRNSVVIKNSKKDRKKSQSGGEEDDHSKKLVKTLAEDGEETQNNYCRLQEEEFSHDRSGNDIRNKLLVGQHFSVHHNKQKHNSNDDIESYVNSIVKIAKHQQEQNGSIMPNALLKSENTVDSYKDGIKRSASDLVHSPNGALSPEKKRRLSHSSIPFTLSALDDANEIVNDEVKPSMQSKDPYLYMRGPIGSTNVGTLPQHSSLLSTKIQKGNNNNNNAPFNKLQKSVSKLKTKAPGTVIKDPGKSYDGGLNLPSKISATVVPQGNMDAICEEKFKQKLMEPNYVTTKSATQTASTSVKVDSTQSSVETTKPALSSSSNVTVKEISCPANSQIVQHFDTQVDEKNSLKCEIVDMSTMPTQRVRGSPGSQVQGEDSGIESMDALSEKSPHQSSSPQGLKRPESPKDSIRKSTVINVDDYTNIVDIEAALAKMEGINELITACDTMPEPQKRKDDPATVSPANNTLAQTLGTTDKIVLCTTSIEHRDLNNILNADTITTVIGPSKDLNENKEGDTKSLLDKQILDECCNKDQIKFNAIKVEEQVKCEDDTISIDELSEKLQIDKEKCVVKKEVISIQTMDLMKNEESIKSSDYDRVHVSTESIDDYSKIKTTSSQTVSSTGQNHEKVDVLNQLSIEIPTGDNAPRVRTRAASKLESPLDIQRQSPSESPACSLKSLKLSVTAIDRLSPKFTAGKGTSRKRQGSESSTQSSVSDETPGKTKKVRKNFPMESTAVTDVDSMPTASPKSNVILNSNVAKLNCNKQIDLKLVHVKTEESSDSDEPLIEIAGKVRNSKFSKLTDERVSRIIKSGAITSKPGQTIHFSASNIVTGKVTHMVDDKTSSISTRRSVRMTLAQGKGIGKCVIGGTGSDELMGKKSTVVQTGQKAGCADDLVCKKSTVIQAGQKANTGLDQSSGDARRKTRSAGKFCFYITFFNCLSSALKM